MAEFLLGFLGEANRAQVFHYGILFILAAFLHAHQVRKEIALQFTAVSTALNNVAKALTDDLAKHSQRLDIVEKEVTNIRELIVSKTQNQGEKK